MLTATVSRGKNLLSIVTKIVQQMCAKAGGVPWTISSLPLTKRPTMICGLDVNHGSALKRTRSYLSLVGSVDPNFAKYFGIC